MLTEAQRHQLYTELSTVLSAEGVQILMDVVGSVTIAELATKTDVALLKSDMAQLRGELKTEMSELRVEMSELRSELRTDMAELRAELKTEMGELRADMSEMKHDLTRSFATMLFVSQGVLVSIVGLLVALA